MIHGDTMVKIKYTFLFLLLALPLLTKAFFIVENKIPKVKIVIPNNCNVLELYAAKELQFHIKKISGAKLDIVKEAELSKGNSIHVGLTSNAKRICPEYKTLSNSGWIVKSTANTVYLLGKDRGTKVSVNTTEIGTLYAV
jgi:hypothetical protein